MALKFKVDRDETDLPRARFDDDEYQGLEAFVEGELGQNASLTTFLLSVARSLDVEPERTYFESMESWELMLEKGHALLTSVDEDGAEYRLVLPEFIELMAAWQEVLIADAPEPLKQLMTGAGSVDRSQSERCYRAAIAPLTKEPELLSDGDELVLDLAIHSLLNWELLDEARKYLALQFELNQRLPDGNSGEFLYYVFERLCEHQMYEQAETALRRAALWVPRLAPEDRAACVADIVKQFCETSRHLNRQSDFTAVCEELPELAKASVYLSSELYKAAGLYDEFLKSSGALNLLDGLAQMMQGALGGSPIGANSSHRPRVMSKTDLEATMRASVHKNAKTTSVYSQMIDSADKLEQRWQSIDRSKTGAPEIYDIAGNFVTDTLLNLRRFQPNGDETFDVSPPTDDSDRSDVGASLTTADAISNMVSGMLSGMGMCARPGSPNAEPVCQWSLRKAGSLMMTKPVLAKKVSAVGGNFVFYFHEDQSTSLSKVADELERELAEQPHFIAECFLELQRL